MKVLAITALLLLAPIAAQAAAGNVPTGSKHGNFLTTHGTTYSPPKQTAGKMISQHQDAHGGRWGWFGLFGVFGLIGLWRMR